MYVGGFLLVLLIVLYLVVGFFLFWGFCFVWFCLFGVFFKYCVPNFKALGIFLVFIFLWFLLPTSKIFFICISFFSDCCPFPTSALPSQISLSWYFLFWTDSCCVRYKIFLVWWVFCPLTLLVNFASYPPISTLCDFFSLLPIAC